MKLRALTSSLLLAVVLALTVAAPASASTNSTYRWRLFLEINQVRRDHGLRVLHIAPGLRTAAQNHSNDMVNRDYFSHTSQKPSQASSSSEMSRKGWARCGFTAVTSLFEAREVASRRLVDRPALRSTSR